MVSQESSAPQTGVGPIVPESLPSHVPHSFPPRIDLGPASSPVRVHLTRILEQLQASATENGTDVAMTLAVLQRQRITTEAAALLRSASRGDKRDAGTEADSNNLNDKFMEVMADAVLTDALGPDNEREQTDMSLPASQYFVSSSHNTYLRGNQLYGEASTSVYKDVSCLPLKLIKADNWMTRSSLLAVVVWKSTCGTVFHRKAHQPLLPTRTLIRHESVRSRLRRNYCIQARRSCMVCTRGPSVERNTELGFFHHSPTILTCMASQVKAQALTLRQRKRRKMKSRSK